MYFYLARNGQYYRSTWLRPGAENALIRIVACFNEDFNLEIYDVRRIAGTDLKTLLNTVSKIIDYAYNTGTKRIILKTNKLPSCYLHKVGFDTVDGCTFFDIFG